MTMPASLTAHLKYLYGPDLLDENGNPVRHTVKITNIVDDEFPDSRGNKKKGISLSFEGKAKVLGVSGVAVTQQLKEAVGTNDPKKAIGKSIIIYPEESGRSPLGWAVRIGKVKG